MRCTVGFQTVYEVEKWRLISNEIKRRDRYICQGCLKRFPMAKLTVHHIFAREQGGDDDPDNLITLCPICHDDVEEVGYMTRAEIYGFRAEEEQKAKVEREKTHDEELDAASKRVDAMRPTWHTWVYGGARNPILDVKR